MQPTQPTDIICTPTSPLLPVLDLLLRSAASDVPVLLRGETGTGKERLARFVHERSGRSGPFVVVHCASLPEHLMEIELFGRAFSHDGRVKDAAGGTLFLDEIDGLSLPLQAALLQGLKRSSARVIVASDADLDAAVAAGAFRNDLYFHFAVCAVDVPALRDRPGDAEALFRHFWQQRSESRAVDDAVFAACAAYDWPGNVREVWNLVERLAVCATGERITAADLPAAFRRAPKSDAGRARPGAPAREQASEQASEQAALDELFQPSSAARDRLMFPVSLPEILRDIENEYIDAALEQTRGNRQAAANILGLQRTTLVEKLRRRDATLARGADLQTMAG